MNYDFDIFDLNPQEAAQDPETSGFLARLGLSGRKGKGVADGPGSGGNRIALFREVQTADALRVAPAALREYFMDAGFGLNTYTSGAPRHCYPAADEQARLDIIERLTALLAAHSLPAPGDYPEGGNVFRMGEFLVDLAEAHPLPQVRSSHPDLAPFESQGAPAFAPTFDTQPAADTAPRRKFWQSRYFLAAVGVGVALVMLQISAGFDQINLASL